MLVVRTTLKALVLAAATLDPTKAPTVVWADEPLPTVNPNGAVKLTLTWRGSTAEGAGPTGIKRVWSDAQQRNVETLMWSRRATVGLKCTTYNVTRADDVLERVCRCFDLDYFIDQLHAQASAAFVDATSIFTLMDQNGGATPLEDQRARSVAALDLVIRYADVFETPALWAPGVIETVNTPEQDNGIIPQLPSPQRGAVSPAAFAATGVDVFGLVGVPTDLDAIVTPAAVGVSALSAFGALLAPLAVAAMTLLAAGAVGAPGAVSAATTVAGAAVAAVAVTGVPGAVVAAVTPASIVAAGVGATGVAGSVSAPAGVALLSMTGLPMTSDTTAGVPVSLGLLAMTGLGVTGVPGAVSAATTVGALTCVGVAATGALTGSMSVPAGAFMGLDATGVPGNTSAATTLGTTACTGLDATGALAEATTLGTMTCAGISVTGVPGAVSSATTVGVLSVTGLDVTGLTVLQTAATTPAVGTMSGADATGAPGAVVAATTAVAGATSGVDVTGSNWSPLDVSSLVYWFDPNVITLDGSNHPTAWVDRKSSLSPTISSGSNTTWTANRLNGKPLLVATGSTILTATTADVFASGAFHLFLAIKHVSGTPNVRHGDGSTVGWGYNASATARRYQYVASGPTITTVTDGNWGAGTEMVELAANGATASLVVNGANQTLTVSSAFLTGGTVWHIRLSNGHEVGHIVACSSVLSGTDLTNMRNFFRNAYAVY